jgi:predicted porin
MKKLLSIAIAAVVAAPMAVNADTTIYGLVDNALTSTDTATQDQWDVEGGNGSSRFGVKGDEDLGNGLKAIFHYEWSVDASDAGTLGGRLGFVGLSGGFGTVAIGRQWRPSYGALGRTNIMNMPGGGYDRALYETRNGNQLVYLSPNFNGFTVAAGIEAASGAVNTPDGVDRFDLGVNYANGPLSVGFGYFTTEGNTGGVDEDVMGLSGKYNFGNFAIVAGYQTADNSRNVANLDIDTWSLGAEAYFGNNTVRIRYGESDADNTGFGAYDSESWALGIQHNFSKRTRVYVEYADLDYNAAAGAKLSDGTADTDASKFAIGLRHDF